MLNPPYLELLAAYAVIDNITLFSDISLLKTPHALCKCLEECFVNKNMKKAEYGFRFELFSQESKVLAKTNWWMGKIMTGQQYYAVMKNKMIFPEIGTFHVIFKFYRVFFFNNNNHHIFCKDCVKTLKENVKKKYREVRHLVISSKLVNKIIVSNQQNYCDKCVLKPLFKLRLCIMTANKCKREEYSAIKRIYP